MKIRHILLGLFAMLAIAFMQPLMTFLGGLTLLISVGALIFRDMSSSDQDAMERRVLNWLRRARAGSAPGIHLPTASHPPISAAPAEPAMPAERIRHRRSQPTPPSES
ncbi:MAG: hypothetical protein JNK95_12410 [Candidatus Competibacter sp.]|nr:hypothetical protein [Candidatus Competibacter sp.]MDG4605177.1 hypothetical protein [Candidatus Contendobacter sp.]HRD48945.1 hypothetical protein [Candidatus Contendobacter sp.]